MGIKEMMDTVSDGVKSVADHDIIDSGVTVRRAVVANTMGVATGLFTAALFLYLYSKYYNDGNSALAGLADGFSEGTASGLTF